MSIPLKPEQLLRGKLTAGDTVANYKIIRLLGKGGMGEVYLAMDVRLGRKVALKIISEKVFDDVPALARFRQEAPAAAALSHPNICAIYDVGEWNDRPYIAMEYVEGATLHEWIQSSAPSLNEILEIAIQIAEALDHARKKNIVHRDIKSSNILLTDGKHVKLLDFGLAKFVNLETPVGTAPSDYGFVLGTVDYMSPEQARGETVDHRSDIFSFGVLLYEMITGQLPFSENTFAQTVEAILHKAPRSIAYNKEISQKLQKVVDKTLQKKPDDRYQTAREICIDLQQIRSEDNLRSQQTLTGRQKKMISILATLILISISLLYYWPNRKWENEKIQRLDTVTSILALPCKVFGPTELGFLTDAIPSSLSTLLARMHGVETHIPPTSFEIEKAQGDLSRIGDAYHVGTFVLSSVSAQSSRLILNVQLVQVSNRTVLWSDQYEGSIHEYIDMTRQAANGIRGALRPFSVPISVAASEVAANSDAELAFRKGQFYASRYGTYWDPVDFDKGLASFKEALDLDPKLARAAGETAILYHNRFEFAFQKTDLEHTKVWAEKTLAIDQNCAEAWVSLSRLERSEQTIHPEAMIRYAIKAAHLDPNSYRSQMELFEALVPVSLRLCTLAAKETHRINPLYSFATAAIADPLIISGRSEEALPLTADLLQLYPGLPLAFYKQSLINSYLGKLPESAAILKTLESLLHQKKFYEDYFLIASEVYSLQAKDYEAATRAHERLSAFTDAYTLIDRIAFTAPLLVRYGNHKAALDLLKRGLEVNVIPYDLLQLSPDLKQMQNDPRYEKIFSGSWTKFQEAMKLLMEIKETGQLPAYLVNALEDFQKEN